MATDAKTKEVARWDVHIASKLLKKHRRLALEVTSEHARTTVKLKILEPASDAKDFMMSLFDMDKIIDAWEVDKLFPIECVEIVKREKEVCFFKTPGKMKSKTREATFRSVGEAVSFCAYVKDLKEGWKEDGSVASPEKKLTFLKPEGADVVPTIENKPTPTTTPTSTALGKEKATALGKVKDDDTILLIEIVSARELAGAKFGALKADPYVMVTLDNEEIHRSKHLKDDMNPIWTVQTDSLFLFRVTKHNKNKELMFYINDFNALRKDKNVGYTPVEVEALIHSNGKRLYYSLLPPITYSSKSLVVPKSKFEHFSVYGKFVVRSRIATESDICFMEKLKMKDGFKNTLCDIEEIVISQTSEASKSRFKSYKKSDSDGKEKYLVRPCPYYKRPEETKWLTNNQVQNEARSETYKWVDIGSGTLAKIYLEIIGCDNLPDKDSQAIMAKDDKTDAFCCIVFEDTVVCTETVKDCLSPRWMPWTQRGFVLNTTSMLSRLFIGVFDKDTGLRAKYDGHDFIGRIAINLSNYEFQTEYLLKFSLRGENEEKIMTPFGKVGPNGTITIRLRLECPDQRALLISSLSIPEKQYINTKTERQHKLAKVVVHGVNDETSYNLGNIYAHYMEIMNYQTILFYLMEGFYAVLLWRGHYKLNVYLPCNFDVNSEDNKWKFNCLKKNSIYLPLYSVILFVVGVTLVESPTLIIPYFFGSIVCIMLALMSYRNFNPSPWSKTKTFGEYLSILIFGKMQPSEEDAFIEPNKNKDEAYMYIKELQDRLAKDQEEKDERILDYTKMQEEEVQFNTEVSKSTAKLRHANKEAMLMAPFKSIIYPYQLMLVNIVYALRFTSSVFLWESSYASFWVTFISFVLFLVCLIIPWAFILTWTIRIIVWALLGPWMKLVDLYYFTPLELLPEEEQAIQKKQAKKLRHEAYGNALEQYKVATEEAVKLKDIKRHMYGDYIVNVPHFHLQMLRDHPLPESSAKYSEENPTSKGEKPFHIAGQHLVGTMIPIPVDEAFAIAAREQEENKKNLCGSSNTLVSSITKSVSLLHKSSKDFIFGASDKSDLTIPLRSPSEKEEVTSYGGLE